MTAVNSSNPDTNSLLVHDVPNGLLAGVSALSVFYSASIEIGDGLAVGTTDDGEVSIAYEQIGTGDIVFVADGSFFGYSISDDDNSRFLQNLGTPLP